MRPPPTGGRCTASGRTRCWLWRSAGGRRRPPARRGASTRGGCMNSGRPRRTTARCEGSRFPFRLSGRAPTAHAPHADDDHGGRRGGGCGELSGAPYAVDAAEVPCAELRRRAGTAVNATTMRAYVLTAPGAGSVQDVPVPEPIPGEVVVDV